MNARRKTMARQPLPEDGSSLTPSQLYAANVDSVVAISSTVETSDYYYGSGEATSTGSGFLFSQDKTLPLRAVVEGFARAYFSNDLNGMEEFLTEDQLPVTQEDLPETDESIVIEKITGLEETVEGYQPGVESVVSVCIVDFQEANRDSFAYLTLGVDMVNGQWKVSGYGMEK